MPKVNIDKDQIKDLLERGVEDVLVRKHLAERLLKGDRLRVKLGIDPTGPKIHLGRAIPLWKLRKFQDLGHQAVLVIGDCTAQIGDPSDKLAKRPFLSPEQIQYNLKNYREQLGKILDLDKVEWRYNGEWLKKLTFMEGAQLAESFSVQQMLARRNFKERLEKKDDISMRELLYPLMQGYDSVVIKADVELGGFDQLFNLMAGRKIQEHCNQPSQDVFTTQMLEGTDGRKMSTTWGNVINITDEPNEMYGKTMAVKDELIPKYLLLTTNLPLKKIDELIKELKKGVNPKIIKSTLARALVGLYYSDKVATAAEIEFNKVHKEGKLPEQMPQFILPTDKKTMPIIELLVYLKLALSKGEARRLVTQGGVKIDGEIVKNWQEKISLKSGLVAQVGSRKFAKLK
jgi:tyrosyl-tRNA synthetase